MITYVPNSNSGKIRKIKKKNENYHNLNICNKNSAESVCSSGQYKKEEIKKKQDRDQRLQVFKLGTCMVLSEKKKVHKYQLPNTSVSLFFRFEVGFWSLLLCPHPVAFFHDAASHSSPAWEVVVSCFGSWVLGPSRKVRSLRFLVWGFVVWAAVETAGLGRRVFGWLACEGVLWFWGDLDCLLDSLSLSFTCKVLMLCYWWLWDGLHG